MVFAVIWKVNPESKLPAFCLAFAKIHASGKLTATTNPPDVSSTHVVRLFLYAMKKYIFVLVIAYSTTLHAQEYFGKYKAVNHLYGLPEVTNLQLNRNLSFDYEYTYDLFSDHVSGTFKLSGDTVILIYHTENEWVKFPVVDTVKRDYSSKGKQSFFISTIDTHYISLPTLNYAKHMRPEKLLYQRNRLIPIKDGTIIGKGSLRRIKN
jgi:hypothetical protein